MCGNVSRDHRPRPDERVGSDRHPANHHHSGSYGGANPDQRRKQFVTTVLDRRARSQVVGEHHPRPKKHVVFDGHTVEQEDAIFNSDTIADRDAALDVYVVTNIAFIPHFGAGENVGECPDPGASADMSTFTQSVWMDENGIRYTRTHDKTISWTRQVHTHRSLQNQLEAFHNTSQIWSTCLSVSVGDIGSETICCAACSATGRCSMKSW